MSCSCRHSSSRDVAAGDASEFVAIRKSVELPHAVIPGESCIFCAEKHVSLAYAAYMQSMQIGMVIGELELARRHTLAEFRNIAGDIARLEKASMLREQTRVSALFTPLLETVAAEALSHDPADITDSKKMSVSYESIQEPVMNPFLGEMHFCAAWRLAFEVGYMLPNRSMIIGDLALAREHLVRFNYDANNMLRDFRHRVQTRRAADLNTSWPQFASGLDYFIRSHMQEFSAEHANALDTYLGIS